jgi:chemotaxis protein methyltransferase CheR
MKLSDEVCRQARVLIANQLGLDFPEHRQADLERGLAQAVQTSPATAPEAYLAWLASLPGTDPEWMRLAGYLTVAETYFFRDGAALEALERQVLPALIAARRAEGTLRLRLWSAGCATGEEPYSLAMVLDRLLPDRPAWTLTILATDVNPEALTLARCGLYRTWSFRRTPGWVREWYFRHRREHCFELDPRLRQMVTFAPLNLAAQSYPSVVTNTSAMDLILCRNVLMYFTPAAQHATVARLQRALVNGGWLVVSPAEMSADLFRPLVAVHFPGTMFYRKEPARGWEPEDRAQLTSIVLRAESEGQRAGDDRRPLSHPPSPDPQVLLQRARALADQGDLHAASRLCEAMLTRDRLDPEAYILLAAIRQEGGDIPAALEALRRVTYLAPNSAPAHFLLGSLLLRQGQHLPGQRAMETAVHLLRSVPCHEVLAGSDGLTAGRLLESAQAYLEQCE